jgi:proliferating cell nuclear antigen PCNA
MKLILSNQDKISQFSVIFQNLKAFSDHVVLYISEEGLYMQGMESSHCSCFESRLTREWFDDYEYNKETDVASLGINTHVFQRVLGTRRDGQTIELEASAGGDTLEITFTGNNEAKCLNKYFELPLMEIEEQLLELGNSDSDVDLVMPSKKFCELISQLQIFDDKLALTFTEERVTFLSSGSEGSMKVNVSFDDVVEYAVAEDTTLKQSYSLKFISMMCLFSKLDEEFVMAFSENRPMEGRFKLGGESYVTFCLAPRVDDEDEF